jgi:hypothetical protein
MNYSFRGLTCGHVTQNRPARRVTLAIKTGQDDLRGGSQATAVITLRDGRTFRQNLNNGQKWKKNSSHHKDINLAADVREQDIASVEVTFQSCSCFGFEGDKRTINSLRLQNAYYQMFTVDGFPAKRLSDQSLCWKLEVFSTCPAPSLIHQSTAPSSCPSAPTFAVPLTPVLGSPQTTLRLANSLGRHPRL